MSSKKNIKFKIDGLDKELGCEFFEAKSEKLAKTIDVTVSPADTKSVIDSSLAAYALRANVKGFRPGKVPLNIVKQQHMSSVMSDSVNAMIKSTSHKITHHEYKVASEIEVDIQEFSEEKGLHYLINLEVFPVIAMPDFAKVKITNYVVNVTDKDIEKSLSEIVAGYKNFEPAKAGTKAKNGDTVLIDFVGKFAGSPFEGGAGKGHRLELGSSSFIPGFEEQLIGAKAGDKKTVSVTFPSDYHSKNHAGKVADFDVEVHEVLHPAQTEINDELATKFGLKDVAELKEKLGEQLKNNYDNAANTHTRKELFDALEGVCKFDCPQGMYEHELKTIKPQFESEKDIKNKEAEKMAERRVKLGMLLAFVASENKIEVSKEDIQAELLKVAKQYPGQERQIIEFYQKDPKAMASLRGPAIEDKAVKLILTLVTKSDKKVTVAELLKMAEEN